MSQPFEPQALRNLRTYRLAKQLAHDIYDVTAGFPVTELRLITQMRGSAISVYGGIAQGYGRNNVDDYIHYCEIAQGALAELGSYVEFCQERQIFNQAEESQLQEVHSRLWSSLGTLISSLHKKRLEGR